MTINVIKKIQFPNKEIKNVNQIFPKMPVELPQLPFIAVLIGSSGTGKTTTACNLIEKYQQHNAFDRICLFSPTGTPDETTEKRL